MAFGGFSQEAGPRPLAEINMIPLIDVMLVLLIIFIITAPLLTQAVKVELPKAAARAQAQTPPSVMLDLKADGMLFWDGAKIGPEELAMRLAHVAARETAPVLHIRADKAATYDQLARVMAQAQDSGVTQIGFVMAPATKRSGR